MNSKRLKIAVVVGVILMASALAMTVFGQGYGTEKAGQGGVIQYKLVPVPSVMTQDQFQTVLTAQGNAGWRFQGPYLVGTSPIPSQTVLLFSKP
ncbi:MAG: hypothetical protein DMF53_15615 [Acidobacteria bacterium]|nr:MAG: hypothetical protein DMF53_15615 [Acidobacteriota bacterium]